MAIPNQAPDSSVAGALQGSPPGQLPAQTPPGQPLENYLQQWVAAVAYMDGTLVRPRWQLEPPNLPDINSDWATLGIIETRPIGPYPAVIRHPTLNDGDGADEVQRQEEFDLLVSFYGPHAGAYASNLHDGLAIWQNYSALRLAGMAFVEIGVTTRVPELIRQQWVDRADKLLTIRRFIRRFYPVLNLLSASARITAHEVPYQTYSIDVSVDPPPPPGASTWDNNATLWDDEKTWWDVP